MRPSKTLLDPTPEYSPNGNGTGLRVLVVEDNAGTSESTATLLRQFGHQVRTVADGPSALEAGKTEPPDVAILASGLLSKDGWLIAKRLWEQPWSRRPLVIAITEQREEDCQPMKAGIHLQLIKPFDPNFLCQVLRRFQAIIMPEDKFEGRSTPDSKLEAMAR